MSPAMRISLATIAAHIIYERIVDAAVSSPDVWVGTRAEIADHVLSMTGA